MGVSECVCLSVCVYVHVHFVRMVCVSEYV